MQVNRRFGRGLSFATNWTWSRLIIFNRATWIPDELTKAPSGRSQAANITAGYAIPDGTRHLGKAGENAFVRGVLDGWHLNGVGSLFSGLSMTVSCSARNAALGWPNGTPTGGIPLRCEMVGNMWLPAGTPVPSTTTKRLWYPFNRANFVLPPGTTLGLGNTPPAITYGPGFENIDLSIFKQARLVKEGWFLELRGEAFNALSHLNPNNPNTSLILDYQTGANTNSAFGSVQSAADPARKVILSVRLRF